MSNSRLVRVAEGDQLPDGTCFLRLVATEEVMVGPGTNTRRVHTLLVSDVDRAALLVSPHTEEGQ